MGIKITGISAPFGGLSWEITESERQGIEKLFYFLEAKRLLTNPIEMEMPEQCATSTIENKNFIVVLLGDRAFSDATKTILRSMTDACNTFLDELNAKKRPHIIYKNNQGDWVDSNYSQIYKNFRSTIRLGIQELEIRFRLKFEKAIPEEY
ncbi:DUF6650 family protein [Paenibacillus sp. MB22_1]|uniref:DUF6650 family protein n=1 Tax=Paenibacillus sp. MB22_1 TaxID=3383121 RepID=UPI0039A237B7